MTRTLRDGNEPVPFPCWVLLTAGLACAVPGAALSRGIDSTAPLPNPVQLKQRVIANEQRMEENRERYLCELHDESEELRADGGVKRRRTVDADQFYVNGQEVRRVLARDGKKLTPAEEKKEQEHVEKEIRRFSDEKRLARMRDENLKQLDVVFRALQYTNERRESINGRSTIRFDLSGDPNFHPSDITSRFVHAAVGQVWIDEESGELLELRIHTDRDVRVAGGLLAVVHKGFQFHLRQERQPDATWFPTLFEGTGDARAGLLFHPRFRFKRIVTKCHLYSVESTSKPAPPN